MKKAFKAAFPLTIPVLLGYVFVAMTFGLLFKDRGYPIYWGVITSFFVFSGSLQFLAVGFFTGLVSFFEVAILSFMVNFRHVFYGLSFLDKYKGAGAKKPFLLFGLTDETYSLLCSSKVPEGIEPQKFYLAVTLLNQSYWQIGTLIGLFTRDLIPVSTQGMEFAMTALFVVIFVEQWISYPSHKPALIGFLCTILCLILFGSDEMVLPAMILIAIILIAFKKPIEHEIVKKEGKGHDNA